MRPAQRSRIESLDVLRGIAALLVAWYHFTNGNPAFIPAGHPLELSGKYGWTGVNIFFVISGFVIPYTLHRSNYKLRNYFRFVLKRMIRLDPPFLAAMVIIIVLGYGSAYVGEHPYHVTAVQVLLHFGYINVFFGYDWLSPVFWTLAIEFQYYLMMGLIFPVIMNNFRSRLLILLLLSCLAFIPSTSFIFHYLFCFLLGITTFHYWSGVIQRKQFIILVVLFGIGCWLTVGEAAAAASLLTVLIIPSMRISHPVLRFFGTISYSVYLLHVTIGGKVLNLSLRFSYGKGWVLLASFTATLVAAYLLYRLIEKPSQKWSSSINYSKEPYNETHVQMIAPLSHAPTLKLESSLAANETRL